jgi:tRNA 2-selenouridine synthase SelU
MLTLRRCSILASNKMSLACLVLACTQSVKGGFKALRRYFIDESYRNMQKKTPIFIRGETGCGKTFLLYKNYNKLRTSKDIPQLNRAIQGLYPPGSTIKPMVAFL